MYSTSTRLILCKIIREYGPEVCEPPSRVRGFLNDLCAEHKADVILLVATLTSCRLAYFQAIKKGQSERLLALKIETLQYELSITEEAAHWAIESWALALNILTAPLPRPQMPTVPELPTIALRLPEAVSPAVVPILLPGRIVQALPGETSHWKFGAVVVGIAMFIILSIGLVTALTSEVRSPPVSADTTVPTSSMQASTVSDSSVSVDPAVDKQQALTQRIQQIRSSLEPGTMLIWPLDGKQNGMKIILPSKRSRAQTTLIGRTDIQQGCQELENQLEQAFRDAGYSDPDFAGCSVFVCTSEGTQVAFSTMTQ